MVPTAVSHKKTLHLIYAKPVYNLYLRQVCLFALLWWQSRFLKVLGPHLMMNAPIIPINLITKSNYLLSIRLPRQKFYTNIRDLQFI